MPMQNPAANTVVIAINGASVTVPAHASVAAVLLAHGVAPRNSVHGEPRSARTLRWNDQPRNPRSCSAACAA